MKLLIGTLLGAGLLISGCSTAAVQNLDTKANAQNVNKFNGHTTQAQIKTNGSELTITFAELNNNMGENYAATTCESSFTYIDAFENLESGNSVAVYGGKWKLSNNNCAHFVETVSAQYTDEQQMRYLLIDGNEFIMSYDKMGKKPLIQGIF